MRLTNVYIMTSPKGMDELLQGKEFEDILDQIERLEMASEVQGYDEMKLFKIAKLNLRGRAKGWFKKLQPIPVDWNHMKANMQQKFGVVDLDELKVKMDSVK